MQTVVASCADVQEGATKGSGKTMPSGVFDWAQSGQSGAWEDPKTLLAYD